MAGAEPRLGRERARGCEHLALRRTPASLQGAPEQHRSCWERRQQIHPAQAPPRAAAAAAGQTIPILPPGPGIRSVPAAAQQLPTHATHTLAHTRAQTRTQKHTHKPRRSPGSPQQRARPQRGGRSGQPGEQPIPLPATRFLQEKPPRRPKNKVNFKVMQIVMQRFSPHTLRLEKLLPTTGGEKKIKQSAKEAQRAVSVAGGSGWTGQKREEE